MQRLHGLTMETAPAMEAREVKFLKTFQVVPFSLLFFFITLKPRAE